MGRKGFTLLEILIAITTIGIILAAIFGILNGMMSSAAVASRRAELYQTGRAVMDLLSADIRGFMPMTTPEGTIFFRVSTQSSRGDIEGTEWHFVTTHALTMGADRNPFLSEIGYRVKKNRNDDLYSLWRRAESPPSLPYEKGGSEVPVCRILEDFQLGLRSVGDTKQDLVEGAVPDAVVLSFKLNLDGEREHFITMVSPVVKSPGRREGASLQPNETGE
ncbi:MAG: prepilin-type N-terminal cleavage/methylation domain-containing protein [Desulfobacteraceae bacterium]|nr:MAG: prepilin-type N-terminal cleavage/methylation domain-containing protein [Desulfobacteraceae bacterium]